MKPVASTFVVLGLLAKKPGSGYELAAFADRTARFFWPISRSQLYAELSRLEQLGWARGTAVRQERYPDKRVYEPTADGLTALQAWLDDAPQQRQRGQELTVLMTFLGPFVSRERLADQLRICREQAERLHAELTAVVEHLEGKQEQTESHRFGQASARYGVLQAEATIAWTEEVQALLADECPRLESNQEPSD